MLRQAILDIQTQEKIEKEEKEKKRGRKKDSKRGQLSPFTHFI
jgi:hypothetical protein